MRGGIADFWPPALPGPVRLEFFGDEVDTLRMFDPVSQRKTNSLEKVLVTPAREVLFPESFSLRSELSGMEEFFIPQVYQLPASLLNFLPRDRLVLLDGASNLDALANEIEDAALRMRSDNIRDGSLPDDFPLPYQPWSDLIDELGDQRWLDLGRGEGQEPTMLGRPFSPMRYGGRLEPFLSDLRNLLNAGSAFCVSRQIGRIKELWHE